MPKIYKSFKYIRAFNLIMITKNLLVLVVLALLLTAVSAISINVEDPQTQGSQWSFTVDFGSLSSVDEGKIYVDGESAITVFEHSGEIFSASVSSKVLSYNVTGNSVVVAYNGMSAGDHTIKAETYNGGSVAEEQSVTINFLKPLSQAEKQTLVDQINSLEGTISGLNSTTSTMKAEINALEDTLADKDSEINSLKQKNTELVNDLSQLEVEINSLEASGASNEEILMTVKGDLDVILEEREEAKKNPIVGFFAAGANSSVMLIALVAIIAIIVIGVFIKKGSPSIYSSSIFSKNDDLKVPKESKVETKKEKSIQDPESALLESEPVKKKGLFSRFKKEKSESGTESSAPMRKWAVESYNPSENPKVEKESKRFELGDLIKK